MINPVSGIITSYFENRINPITHKKEFHNGIDIATKKGTPIIAVAGGCVTEVSFNKEYGNYIKYSINDEYTILYAHCNTILVEKGQIIHKADAIATVGSTGMATGPHLHYSILYHDAFIDPKPFLTIGRGGNE
jgi:murein DD-endopeptidase MepM/ murein hydrolase activator NlpD